MSKSVYALVSFALSLQLFSACTPPTSPDKVPAPQVSATPTVSEDALFDSALSRTPLDAGDVLSSGSAAPTPAVGTGASAGVPTGFPMPAPSAAPTARPFPGADISAGYGGYGGYGYFSGNFDQYVALRAEQLRYPGSEANDLQTVYRDRVQSILAEWDPNARLVESRGQSRPNPDQPEYIYLPGDQGNETITFNAHWVLKFVSTPRKETLDIYINPTESRAYRVIYGQPELDLNILQISTSQAIETAKAAFASRSQPDYTVNPDPNAPADPQRTIIYDLPSDLNWQTHLLQQGSRLIYALNFNYTTSRKALNLPVPPAIPSSMSMPTASPTDAPNTEPRPEVTPTPTPMPMATPLPISCYGSAEETIYLSGSISIDAVSGEVISLNRPVYYDYYNPSEPCRPYPIAYPAYSSPDPQATMVP